MVTISVTSNVEDEGSVPSEMKKYYRRHFGNYFTMHNGEHVSTGFVVKEGCGQYCFSVLHNTSYYMISDNVFSDWLTPLETFFDKTV
jgi:hypothetical protein